MNKHLLNDNQRRRLTTVLHVLIDDIQSVQRHQSLDEAMRTNLDAVTKSAREILEVFGLPSPVGFDAESRVRALGEIWGARAYDIRADRLVGYGPVHPELAACLDPLVEELQTSLRDLALD